MEQKQNKKFTPTQAIEYLDEVTELLEFYLGSRGDYDSKDFLKKMKQTKKLIEELEDDQFQDRKAFKNKFFSIFRKKKEEIEQENKKLKIELEQERHKND